MIPFLYNLMAKVGITKGHDKVLHFGVMVLVLSFSIPLAIWLSNMYLSNALFSSRDIGQITILILSQIAIFYKEYRDGFVGDWFFDVMAGELGVFVGFVIGGGVIARLLGL